MTTEASEALRRASEKIDTVRQRLAPASAPPPITEPVRRVVVPNALRMTGQ